MSQINCPTCGAKTSSVIANCEYCGIEIKRAAESKITPQEMTDALTKRIQACRGWWPPKNQKQAEVIHAFPLPTDVNLLAQLLMFCHGNIKGRVDMGIFGNLMGFGSSAEMVPDQQAWKAKACALYQALRLAALNNPQLTTFLAPFDQIYGIQASQGHKGLAGVLGKIIGR